LIWINAAIAKSLRFLLDGRKVRNATAKAAGKRRQDLPALFGIVDMYRSAICMAQGELKYI
jgi:hypothetical protein